MRRHQTARVLLGVCVLFASVAFVIVFATRGVHGSARSISLIASGLGVALAYSIYWTVSWRAHTASETQEAGNHLPTDIDNILTLVEKIQPELHLSQAAAFLEAIIEPQARFERITETVEPMVRSLLVTTAYTFQDPPEAAGRTVAIPLILQRRGALIDGLSVRNSSGERVSTLGRSATLALEAAIFRVLVSIVGEEATADYKANIERDIVEFLSASDQMTLEDANRIADRISSLPSHEGTEAVLVQINRTLRRLRRVYPLMVFAKCDDVGSGGAFLRTRQRFTVERRVAATLIPHDDSGVEGWLNRARDRVRRLLGIRPAVIGCPLVNADRCSGYHAQIRGPEGTYLARQRIVTHPSGETADLSDVYFDLRDRLGQRISHLYVRNGQDFSSRYFVCNYFERMPGSLGSATMSALGAAVLILIAAMTRLGDTNGSSPDLVAVILAFPAIAGTWLGLAQSRGLFGGVLMARVSLIATVAVALFASSFYAVGPGGYVGNIGILDRPGATIWIVLVGISALNLLACIGGWLLRANVEAHFIKKTVAGMDDLGFDNE